MEDRNYAGFLEESGVPYCTNVLADAGKKLTSLYKQYRKESNWSLHAYVCTETG
jgi:hypothetical protein